MKKEKDPKYTKTARRNAKIATHCRVCGGQLLTTQEITKEMQERGEKEKTKREGRGEKGRKKK